jgi:NADPH:quinone reductase-like Zn-dependent oxidoreductase
MWAVVIEEYGSPEVLQLKEIPNLEPNRGLVELLRQIGARHG